MTLIRENLRLIWADKIVLTIGVLAVIFAAVVWAVVAIAAGPMGANHVLASIGLDGTIAFVSALAAIWAGLRALDFAFGGSTFRLFHPQPVADAGAPAIPAGNLVTR